MGGKGAARRNHTGSAAAAPREPPELGSNYLQGLSADDVKKLSGLTDGELRERFRTLNRNYLQGYRLMNC